MESKKCQDEIDAAILAKKRSAKLRGKDGGGESLTPLEHVCYYKFINVRTGFSVQPIPENVTSKDTPRSFYLG